MTTQGLTELRQSILARYFRVLNRCEPHLPCVICRRRLVDGDCQFCNSEVPA